MPDQCGPPLLLGAIADDFTGAADLASMLSSHGARTVLALDPAAVATGEGTAFDAVVVALKSRDIPAPDACAMSLAALEQLQVLHPRQIYFKYCSTFDSSADGNIGPVCQALLDALEASFTIAVPALPVNGRTQYLGYLFVNERLLSETHMRHHPVHPMTDANLVRHLQSQMDRPVGLISHARVREGPTAIREAAVELAAGGTSVALVDALTDEDLTAIAEAVIDLPLVTGGSGLGMALAVVWQRHGLLETRGDRSGGPPHIPTGGGALMLAGSCSDVTLGQIAALERTQGSGTAMDVLHLLEDFPAEVDRLYRSASEAISETGWALVRSSTGAEERRRLLDRARAAGHSSELVSRRVEAAHGEIASRAVQEDLVRHVVVAGGETSGAVATALNLPALEILDVLDPGVPLMRPLGGGAQTLIFKSGNFGSSDFFGKVLARLCPSVLQAT